MLFVRVKCSNSQLLDAFCLSGPLAQPSFHLLGMVLHNPEIDKGAFKRTLDR